MPGALHISATDTRSNFKPRNKG